MALAFVTGTSATGNNITVLDTILTIGATSDVLIAQITWGASATRSVTGVTWAGVSMTPVASSSVEVADGTARHGVAQFRLVAPATGAQHLITTMSGACTPIVHGLQSFSGGHQTAPVGTAATNTGTGNGLTATVTVSSAADEIVTGCCNLANSNTTADLTSADTQAWDNENKGSFDNTMNGEYKAGDTSTVLTWNKANTVKPWAATAVPVKPAGEAPATANRILFPAQTSAMGVGGMLGGNRVN